MNPATLLRKHKLRSTPVRRSVLEQLSASGKSKSAQALEQGANADRVTMYRTLITFEQCGILHKIVDGTGVDKYALCKEECSNGEHVHAHAHFNCWSCGATTCLHEVAVQQVVLPKGYALKETQLTYKGYCDTCQSSAQL